MRDRRLHLGVGRCDDLLDGLVAQSRPAVPPAPAERAVPPLVRLVLALRPPREIVQTGVAALAIEVARLHARRTGADEGLEDEAVDAVVGSVPSPDSEVRVSAGVGGRME